MMEEEELKRMKMMGAVFSTPYHHHRHDHHQSSCFRFKNDNRSKEK